MALSNMANEPRREIIETTIGMVVAALFVLVDYLVVAYFNERFPNFKGGCPLVVQMFVLAAFAVFAVFAFIMLWMVASGVHALGESVCAKLAKLGHDPRPVQRFGPNAPFDYYAQELQRRKGMVSAKRLIDAGK